MSTYTFHCKMLNVPYKILERRRISFRLEHYNVIGYASFDGYVFEMFTNAEYNDIILDIIQNGGGFSHGGNFDMDGDFVLDEISVTKSPRYKSEVF